MSTQSTMNPPGNQIATVTFNKLINKITFPNPRPSTPFPPLVQAYFEENTLQVSAVVLIDSNATINTIQVFFDGNQLEPNLYIAYDAPEVSSANFIAYQVDFNLPLENQPKKINTVVWNEDPETSRGTITTVQP